MSAWFSFTLKFGFTLKVTRKTNPVLELELNKESVLFSILEAAGWPIWPLLICSIIVTALIIERLYQLRAELIAPKNLLDEVLRKVDQGAVSNIDLETLKGGSPMGAILAATLKAFNQQPQAKEQELREEIELEGKMIAHDLERFQAAIATIASAAPLLGLFGTVVGMIDIFGSQSGVSNNPAQLAHGISTALYNTAFGLIIAIPSLICWRYFRTQIESFVLTLEGSSEKLLKHLVRKRY